METIKINYSLWRMLVASLVCVAFVAVSVFNLEHAKDHFATVMSWISIVFFGFGSFLLPYVALRERIKGYAYLTITDEEVITRTMRTSVICLADVEVFKVAHHKLSPFISVRYKRDLEKRNLDYAETRSRSIRNLNISFINVQSSIILIGTGVNAEILCHLLNERLENLKKSVNQ